MTDHTIQVIDVGRVTPVGPRGPAGAPGANGTNGRDGVMTSIVPGTNITVTATDPANPVVAAVVPASAPPRRVVNVQTGTTYAPTAADENTMVTLNNAAAITVTLPAITTPLGMEVDFAQLGLGQVTFAAGSGATVNATPTLKLRTRYSAATAKLIAVNTWLVMGDMA